MLKETLTTTPINVSDHLSEQFAWTNKKHLAGNLMKPKTTPFKRFRLALSLLYMEGFVTRKEYDKILGRLLKKGRDK